MKEYHSIYDPPKKPAIYVMYAGKLRKHVAYVGLASKLQTRLYQHFVKKDSSVTSGGSATGLNPDYISKVIWWEHEIFAEKDQLQAAEIIAFDYFKPTLVSRGKPSNMARQISKERSFKRKMIKLFQNEPSGIFFPLTLDNLNTRLENIEITISLLERSLNQIMEKLELTS